MIPVAEAISHLCNYKFDDWDKDVIETAMKKVDEDRNIWFDYKFAGDFNIRFSFTISRGSSNYSIKIEADENIEQAVNAIIALAQSYEIKEFE